MAENQDYGWGIFLQPAPFGDTTYLGWIWMGIQITVALSICSWVIAFVVGSFFGILRTVPNRFLAFLGTAYVALFRNVPLLVQFFAWVFVMPEFLPDSISSWLYNKTPFAFLCSIICLGLFTGARVCEQVRTAIQALPRGQQGAALALGLTLPQSYRYVLLPNAYRLVIPPMTSEMLNMIKNSAVASMVGLLDLTGQANNMLEHSNQPYQSFIAITLIYVAINLIVMQLMRVVEKRARLPGTMGAK